jgi:hypothetical protein
MHSLHMQAVNIATSLHRPSSSPAILFCHLAELVLPELIGCQLVKFVSISRLQQPISTERVICLMANRRSPWIAGEDYVSCFGAF